MKNRRVVITGGAGFIGSNLADELSQSNDVTIIDDLSSGRLENIRHLLDKGNITFIQGSVTDLPLLRDAFKGVAFVFHQAAMASVSQSVADPLRCHEVNAGGTLSVLMAARDNGVSKVIFASSCAVYGDSPPLPTPEDALPAPQSPYAAAKLAGEQYCRVFCSIYGLPAVSLRYFNVYGPRQDPRSDYAAVIPRFISRALENQPLTIFGDGSQTRDFVFVKDVVRANILAAEGETQGVYNIGSGEGISINVLAETIGASTGHRSETVHQEPRSGDILHSLADIGKARAMGYQPGYSLQAGLKEMVRWFSKS